MCTWACLSVSSMPAIELSIVAASAQICHPDAKTRLVQQAINAPCNLGRLGSARSLDSWKGPEDSCLQAIGVGSC